MILAVAVAAVWAALAMPLSYLLAATLLLGWTLCVLSAVDFLAFRLPDILTLPLVAIGLLLALWLPERDIIGHAIGAASGFLVLYLIATLYRQFRAREGLGLGDAKLAAAAGAWLGWQALPTVLLVASIGGLVWVSLATYFRGRSALNEQMPFGVPLCVAFWLEWLWVNGALF